MSLIESIKTLLKNPDELLKYRLQASKFFFIVCALLFFINYVFLGAGFLTKYAKITFSFTYAGLVLSFFLYTSLVLLYYFRGKMRLVAYGMILFLFLLMLIFFVPVLVGGSIFSFLA